MLLNLQAKDFEANVGANVTTLLVLTTIFISVSEALPKTSYVKMMDVWLIFNLMIPFVQLILQTMIERIRIDDDHGSNKVTLFREAKADNEDLGAENVMQRVKDVKEIRKLLQKGLKLIAIVVVPCFYFIFCGIYFIIGNLAF